MLPISMHCDRHDIRKTPHGTHFRVRHDVSLICFENTGSAHPPPLRDKMRRGMRKSLTYSGLKNRGGGEIVIA